MNNAYLLEQLHTRPIVPNPHAFPAHHICVYICVFNWLLGQDNTFVFYVVTKDKKLES